MNIGWKRNQWTCLLSAIVLTLYCITAAAPCGASISSATAKANGLGRYGELPMAFEANAGQTDARVDFFSQGSGYRLFLTSGQAAVMVNRWQQSNSPSAAGHKTKSPPRPAGVVSLQMEILGADPTIKGQGVEKLPGRRNYLIGKSPEKWKTDIPTYAKVQYKNIYKGIDLFYYGNDRELEYDFVVRPGASVDRIRLGFNHKDYKKGVCQMTFPPF